MKRARLVLLLWLGLAEILSASRFTSEREIFEATYGRGEYLSPEEIEDIRAFSFPAPFHRDFALIQALSCREESDVAEAIRLAQMMTKAYENSWIGDLAALQLAGLLQLSGQDEESVKLSKKLLTAVDFGRLKAIDDPFLAFLRDREAIKSFDYEAYLRDLLRLRISHYYLNRGAEEGAVAFAKAQEAAADMEIPAVRREQLRQVRYRAERAGVELPPPPKPSRRDIPPPESPEKSSRSDRKAASAERVSLPSVPHSSDGRKAANKPEVSVQSTTWMLWLVAVAGVMIGFAIATAFRSFRTRRQ